MAENCVEWVVAFLAGLRAGAVVVPLNTRLGSDEVRRQIDACAPRLVLATEAFRPLLETAAGGRTVLALERDCRSLLGVGPARRGRARRATTGRAGPHRLHVGDDR